MSEPEKTVEETVEETPAEVRERPRGDRGEVGEATASLTIKQRHHQTHFKRVDAEDKGNPNRQVWVKNKGAPSLKKFARQLVSSGDPIANDWFAHKNGSLNQKRSDANEKAAREAAMATKTAKHKTGKK